MDLHPGEHILFSGHPSWRSTLALYIKGVVLTVVVGAIVWFAVGHGAGIGAAIAVFALVLLVGFIERLSTLYMVTDERLHIRRGILSRRTQETRIERVQNVNTDQSILQRILQIGIVDFDTAGTEDSDFTFRGVANPGDVVQAVDQARRDAVTRGVDAPARPEL